LQKEPFSGKSDIYIGWNPGFGPAFAELGHTSAQLALLVDRVRSPITRRITGLLAVSAT
jgi:hypothetical protein